MAVPTALPPAPRPRTTVAPPAAAPDAAAARSLDAHVEIETPELVPVSFAIAGIGSRMAAALVDLLLSALILVAIDVAGAAAARALPIGRGGVSAAGPWVVAVLLLLQFAVLWGYHVLFEALADGQTPGKRWRGLRVVQDGGYSVTFGVAAVRNLLRVVDAQPALCYLVGMTSAVLSPRGKRLGDLVAGTIVVQERVAPAAPRTLAGLAAAPLAASPAAPAAPRTTLLDDDAFAVVDRFLQRRAEIDPQRARALAQQLAARLAPALAALAREGGDAAAATANGNTIAALAALRDRERLARTAGAAIGAATGVRRERHALVAKGSARWATFAARVATARRRGLAALGEEELSAFAADYREVAADLARLRTASAGRIDDESFRLGRTVAEAHNLLYRRDRMVWRDTVRYVARTLPREIRRSAAPVLLAAACLFGPAAIAWVVVQRTPEVAREFVPPAMLERAADGVERARKGTGYIEDPGLLRPTMASSIIANNVQVTFGAFALGITAGVGTLLLLVVNGVHIGAVMGLYASKGILPLLLAFVAPHGVLELSAICIGAGGGLLLAAAVLLPGERTRRDALVDNGRRAVHLVVAATLMLLVAGSIEGLVSPIPDWPLSAKLAVSGVTALAFAAWLALGAEPVPAREAREER